MRIRLSSGAATVLFGALFVGAGAAVASGSGTPPSGATPPVPESPPLSCSTANFSVTSSPTPATCGTGPCTDYGYAISSSTKNISSTVFAVSATQLTVETAPAAYVGLPGQGDGPTDFLEWAQHEYTVRFNANYTKSFEAHIRVAGSSKPRVGTVLIKSGSSYESCLIATPGIAGDTFQPVFQSQTVTLAGGKCTATLVFDSNGDVSDIINPTPIPPNTNCLVGSPTSDNPVLVNGTPLRNNSGPYGITFGNGTTTCYGPPRPSTPKCICTATPCP